MQNSVDWLIMGPTLVLNLLLVSLLWLAAPAVSSDGYNSSVSLAINALASTKHNVSTLRRLEINWILDSEDKDKGATIMLFEKDPDQDPTIVPLLVVDPAAEKDSSFLTDVQLPYLTSEQLGYTSKCVFNYWVKMFDSIGNPLTGSRCLKVQPTWMFDNKVALEKLRFLDLKLTGTHDASAYL